MVGSISWIINTDGIGELIEPVQIDTAPITPTPATADPISEPPPRSPSSTTCRPLRHYQRRQINNDDLIASIDQVGQKLADCLSIAQSALDTLVQHRPPSDLDLSKAARETVGVMALPFGFSNAATVHQHSLRGKLADQVAVQLPPAVNTLHLGRSPRAHLQTIPEEAPGFKSQGSMENLANEVDRELYLIGVSGLLVLNDDSCANDMRGGGDAGEPKG